VKENRELLSCDFVFLSDGEMILGRPTIELGNRGIVNFALKIRTADTELHSGIYGGAAPNAIHELTAFIQGLFDSENRLTIEGLYDDVEEVDTEVGTPFDREDYAKNTGAKTVITETEYDFHIATGQRPALSVISIEAGYRGEGYKTTIPPIATAKFNLRLVNKQDPQKIAQLIEQHIIKTLPPHVSYEVSFDEFAKPNKTDINNEYVKRAEKILEELFETKTVRKYVGGTEPAISCFSEYLNKPIVSIPFANEDGHMHGTNENFLLANIEKGMEFSKRFFGKTT
jgi:acetylornithine deacetylase/succinyl-diaminopimelate desuccinylase-like protein